MKTKVWLTIGGWVVTLASAALGFAGVAIGNKQQQIMIDEAVDKRLAERFDSDNKHKKGT